ncbi:Protein phosphatase inhibitor [Drechmeria coniospora]|uniref:Type 1 phosphatases regulator n=1 Tax=Drechmeria coniospora TaxID=98403 RepID=A0A151GF62_DRECN|nr:Protein phosphatase inhibitor [Drechmeria coniospora]KYK55740.1 Protein phosphatase inhibitor [Drechmeria coniospora]ODA81660.1 hypothetical protein RJ55_00162 [Drechmeria coniospora]
MADGRQPRDTPTTSQSTTTTTTTTQTAENTETRLDAPRILRLRGEHTATGRSVQWAEDVIDNETLGRKSSKVCCIYHRPKAVDESSDESSSDSSSDGSSDSDSGADRKQGGDGKKTPACGHAHHGRGKARGRRKKPDEKQKRPPSPNAYEKLPKQKPRDEPTGSKA